MGREQSSLKIIEQKGILNGYNYVLNVPKKEKSFQHPYMNNGNLNTKQLSLTAAEMISTIKSELPEEKGILPLNQVNKLKINLKTSAIFTSFDIAFSIIDGEDYIQAIGTSVAGGLFGAAVEGTVLVGVSILFPITTPVAVIATALGSICGNYFNAWLDYMIEVYPYRKYYERFKYNENKENTILNELERLQLKIELNERYNFPSKEINNLKLKAKILEYEFEKNKNRSLKKSDFQIYLIIEDLEKNVPVLKERIKEKDDPKVYNKKDYYTLKLMNLELNYTIKYINFLKDTILLKVLIQRERISKLIESIETDLNGIAIRLAEKKYFISISLRKLKTLKDKTDKKNKNHYNYAISEYERVIKAIDSVLKGNQNTEILNKIPQIIDPNDEYLITNLHFKDALKLIEYTIGLLNNLSVYKSFIELINNILKNKVKYPEKDESIEEYLKRRSNLRKGYSYTKYIKKIMLGDYYKSVNERVVELSRLHFFRTDYYITSSKIKEIISEFISKGKKDYSDKIKKGIADYQIRRMIDNGRLKFNPYVKNYNEFVEDYIKKNNVEELVKQFFDEINTKKKLGKHKDIDNRISTKQVYNVDGYQVKFLDSLRYKLKLGRVLSYRKEKMMDWESEDVIRKNPLLVDKYFKIIIQNESNDILKDKERKEELSIHLEKVNSIYNFFMDRGIRLNFSNLRNSNSFYEYYKEQRIQIEKEELNNSLSEKKERFRRKNYPDNKFNLRKEKDKLISEQQKYEEELKNTIDKDEIEELKTKINQISEVLYSDNVSEDNPYGSRYKVYKEREKQSDDKAVMKSLIRNDKEYNPEEHKSFREYIEDKFKSLDSADYKKLLEEGNEFQNKVNKVLKYIWNNPEIDSSLFTESYLYNNPELVDLYYKQMEVENKSKDMDEKIIVYDTKAVLEEIESMKNIFENHKKNIAIHNYEFNITNNISRLTQLFA